MGELTRSNWQSSKNGTQGWTYATFFSSATKLGASDDLRFLVYLIIRDTPLELASVFFLALCKRLTRLDW